MFMRPLPNLHLFLETAGRNVLKSVKYLYKSGVKILLGKAKVRLYFPISNFYFEEVERVFC